MSVDRQSLFQHVAQEVRRLEERRRELDEAGALRALLLERIERCAAARRAPR